MHFIKTVFCGLILISYANIILSQICIKSVQQIVKENSGIQYIACLEKQEYRIKPFLEPLYKTKGNFDECFILNIPNGIVRGFKGAVFFGNDFIKEMVWANRIEFLEPLINVENATLVSGRVAVIAQFAADSYCHFMHECLGRLALLEMQGIEYDYLYISSFKPFVKEMLELWGIDPKKIIVADETDYALQADMLIVPSLVINSDGNFENAGFFPHPVTSNYVRDKLLQGILKLGMEGSNFSKKVFISRKDAPLRKIINEDEIFELFKPYGFIRYELSNLTVLEQIMLMHNADIIIGEHGAGLTNILFCKPDSLIIELFQELIDGSDWWIAHLAQLQYIPVNLLQQDTSWSANWKNNFFKLVQAWSAQIVVPLDEIKKVINNLKL